MLITVGLACRAFDLAANAEALRAHYWSMVGRATRSVLDRALDDYLLLADQLDALRAQVRS